MTERTHNPGLGRLAARTPATTRGVNNAGGVVTPTKTGDTNPHTADEIAKVTGPARMDAHRAVRRAGKTITAARATNRLANALLLDPAATPASRNALWEKIVAGMPEGRAAPGIRGAENIIRTCQSYEKAQGLEGFRGCLQYRHDQLMFSINDTYWLRSDVGS